jgi:GT2 family glycosyltransferase
MKHISFVILNYKTWEESAACADSILKSQTWEALSLVIVDNGSGNDSVQRLREKYAKEARVHVVAAEKNLGFAKGNNLGIAYAREHFDPDFIVAANSDIIFEQPDYCRKIAEIYEKRPYALLGGDIIDASRTQHFNPVAERRVYSISYMRKQIAVSQLKAVSFRLIKALHLKRAVAGHYKTAEGASKNLTTREVDGKSVSADSRIEEAQEGVLLHGCCIVFSRDFFAEFDGFYDQTFLYAEEEILYYLAMKKGLTVLYSPEVVCMHKEAVTTNRLYRDFCDAKIFYFSNITKSYRAFLRLMKE